MLAAMTLYVIPIFYLLYDFDYLMESVAETFPDMNESYIRTAALSILIFWPVAAVTSLILGNEE